MSIYSPKLKEIAHNLIDQEWYCSWRVIELLEKHFADLPQEKIKEFYEELCLIVFNCITRYDFTVDDFAINDIQISFEFLHFRYFGAVIQYKKCDFIIVAKNKNNETIKLICFSYDANSDFCKYFECGKYYEGEI